MLSPSSPPYIAVARFSAHIITGLVMFAVIAFSGLGVGWMADYLKTIQYPNFLTTLLSMAEGIILAVDFLLFVVFSLRSIMSFYLELKNGGDHE